MPPMFPLRTRRTATRQLTANEAFCKAQLDTEQLLARIQQLQVAAFGADENTDRHWGDVGSLNHFNGLLRQALEHYGING